jgi:2-polyprenyl-3-methyl-5-hydroxy-6-metoxy-1,4-benzoquinol methylase
VPNAYTHGHHGSVLRSHGWRTAENSAGYLLTHLRPGMRVLDVGCGPGSITAGLAHWVAPGDVVGIDTSESVVARAAGQFRAENLRFRTADLYTLDEPAGFDVVHMHQVLQHLADPVAALRRLGDLTRPGGLIAVREADYHGMFWYPDSDGLQAWLRLYQQAARVNGGEPDAGRHLAAWARAAGYTDIEVSSATWCFADPGDRDWWSQTWAERVTDSALARQAERDGLAGRDQLTAMAQAWRQWGALPDAVFVVPHVQLLIHR